MNEVNIKTGTVGMDIMQKILIVEDDRKLNDGICLALKQDSFLFFQCDTIAEAREMMKRERLSLILLDVNSPDRK